MAYHLGSYCIIYIYIYIYSVIYTHILCIMIENFEYNEWKSEYIECNSMSIFHKAIPFRHPKGKQQQ